MVVPPNGWFIRENPNLKWMRTGGTPMTQETSTYGGITMIQQWNPHKTNQDEMD